MSCKSFSLRDCAPVMKLLWLTRHPWGLSVFSSADYMDTHWASATFPARLTYWSVTQDILLNSRMTSSPVFSLVGILIANPSGLLFHSLSRKISSIGVPVFRFLSSASVKGRVFSCPMVAFSRVCTEHQLKTSGNSSSKSFQTVRRFFSPLTQTNLHLEDARRCNSE